MKVLCVGLMVCDIVVKPVDTDTFEKDTYTAENIEILVGGDAANVAYNINSLGLEVTLLSAVGSDFFADYILKHLKDNDLSTDYVLRKEGITSKSAVLISDKGERAFISQKGACHNVTCEEVTEEILKSHDILYIGSAGDLPHFEGENLTALLQRARSLGLKTVLDVTGEVDQEWLKENKSALQYLDVFLPSIREAKRISGCKTEKDCLDFFASCGVKTTCIKLGKLGSCVLVNNEVMVIPPYDAKRVDTTGAGDSFVAGFIAGIISGLNETNCCKLGNYTGSITVSDIGAQVKLRPLSEILNKLF